MDNTTGIDEETPASFKKKIVQQVFKHQEVLKLGCTSSDIEVALNALSQQIGRNYLDYALNEGVEVASAATNIIRNLPTRIKFTHN